MGSGSRERIVEVFDALDAELDRLDEVSFEVLTTPERLRSLEPARACAAFTATALACHDNTAPDGATAADNSPARVAHRPASACKPSAVTRSRARVPPATSTPGMLAGHPGAAHHRDRTEWVR